MTPIIGNTDFSGGLNVRELGHLIKPNEATLAEGFNIEFASVRALDGDIRELLDLTNYPEIVDATATPVPGTGGGVPNDEPILGCWRYYYNDGYDGHNAWVRVHGTTVEYWTQGGTTWTTIGIVWPNGAVPTAVQFENTIYIMHGDPAIAYSAKYLLWTGAAWVSGDAPAPVAPIANLRPAFAVNYRNRLYAVDVANEPFRVRYSGVNLPEAWNAPNGGYVTLGDTSGDPITGLYVHRDVLLIFKRSSVWRYWVDEYGWEHMGRIHGAAGCLVHRSICAYKDAVYYASDEGMIAIYGADSDCVTHKIAKEIEIDPDYVKYMQAVVHAQSGTLWVTYLKEALSVCGLDSCGDPVLDECGDPALYHVYKTDVWKADIRRPNIIKPRWVKLPYYRLTSFAMPPQANTYKGNDNTSFLHFCAQQPDVTMWNDAATPDLLYPNYQAPAMGDLGGPRHYNYRYGANLDRDQVPAYTDACLDPLYAGDDGVGYWLRFKTPRYLPVGNMRDINFGDMRLDYFIWKAQIAVGLDAAYSRIWIGRDLLAPADDAFPLDTTLWPIQDNTEAGAAGGAAWQEYTLKNMNPSSGRSLMMEWTVIGLSSRVRPSWRAEFRFWGCEYDVGADKLNPED